jgi:hypothetical protein
MQKQSLRGGGEVFGPDDATLVTFSTSESGEPVQIGGNQNGKVYVGRVRFEDGSVHRAAVKRFNVPLSDDDARLYQQTIDELRAAGVGLVKMGMVKLPAKCRFGGEELICPEWVQVSQLYGSSKGSKLENRSETFIGSEKGRLEAVTLLAKVANAGQYPVLDLFEPFKDSGKGVLPLDVDTLVKLKNLENLNPDAETLANFLADAVEDISQYLGADDPEREKLWAAMTAAASPEIKAELKKINPYDNPEI